MVYQQIPISSFISVSDDFLDNHHHVDIIFNEKWNGRLIGLKNFSKNDTIDESSELRICRAVSILRYTNSPDLVYENIQGRRQLEGISAALKKGDVAKKIIRFLGEDFEKSYNEVENSEQCDVSYWKSKSFLNTNTVISFLPYYPFNNSDDGWGVAYSCCPISGQPRVSGEYYPNSDWNLVEKNEIVNLSSQLFYETICQWINSHHSTNEYPARLIFIHQNGNIVFLHKTFQSLSLNAALTALDYYGLNAVHSIKPQEVTLSLKPYISSESSSNLQVVEDQCKPIVCGASTGHAVFSIDQISKYEKPILLVSNPGCDLSAYLPRLGGIIAEKANTSSHLTILAARDGIPFFTGLEINKYHALVGKYITLASVNDQGIVFEGKADLNDSIPSDRIMNLIQQIQKKSNIKVHANADTGKNARRAKELGGIGISLLRTEHLLTDEKWKPFIAKLIHQTPLTSLEEKELYQHHKFSIAEVLDSMPDLPVTIRLLDAPLHEFIDSKDKENLIEKNPMMGFRGCRLLIARPQLIHLQCKSIFDAAEEVGAHAKPKIMIPLIADPNEFNKIRKQILSLSICNRYLFPIGAMLETPRSCFFADFLVKMGADFFSFGTNDLTQFAWGLSRDDASDKILPAYYSQDIIDFNPFGSLDTNGVGRLMKQAVDIARSVKPEISFSICGEQATHINSIPFLHKIGINVIGSAPDNIPVTIMKIAKATIGI